MVVTASRWILNAAASSLARAPARYRPMSSSRSAAVNRPTRPLRGGGSAVARADRPGNPSRVIQIWWFERRPLRTTYADSNQ
jgi:hypothetical protein